jgi:type II secretory pathway pseudopilin PulG
MATRRAVTLAELLVVIGIIAVLGALLLPVLSLVRFQAKVTGTGQRMQQIITALQDYAAGDRSATALQIAASLGGPSRLVDWWTVNASLPATVAAANRPPGTGHAGDQLRLRAELTLEVMPDAADFSALTAAWWTAKWPYLWPASDWPTLGAVPPVLPYPWGRPGLCMDLVPTKPGAGTGATGRLFWFGGAVYNRYMIGSGNNSAPVAESQNITRSDGSTATVTGDNPYPFDLGQLSPLRTVELLSVIGLLDGGATAYAADRNPNRPWNDLWGNPLIIAYAVFHPSRHSNGGLRDRYVKGALKQYGYAKALYLAVGATGPALRAGIAADAATPASLRDRWLQIRDTCRAAEWTELTWAAPPGDWREYRKGVQTVDGTRETCLLSAPVELK